MVSILRICFIVGTLCLSHAWATEVARLGEGISEEYRRFQPPPPSPGPRLSKPVQFLRHLMSSTDPHARTKAWLVLSRGEGVGGVGSSPPPPEEEEAMVEALGLMMAGGGITPEAISGQAAGSSGVIKRHEETLWDYSNVLLALSDDSGLRSICSTLEETRPLPMVPGLAAQPSLLEDPSFYPGLPKALRIWRAGRGDEFQIPAATAGEIQILHIPVDVSHPVGLMLLHAASSLPAAERQDFVDSIVRIFRLFHLYDGTVIKIIRCVGSIANPQTRSELSRVLEEAVTRGGGGYSSLSDAQMKNFNIFECVFVINNLPPPEREQFINLLNLHAGGPLNVGALIGDLGQMSQATRINFIRFIRANNLSLPEITVLIRLEERDWADTLRGMRLGGGGGGRIIGIHRQTVHDQETEDSIRQSVERLEARYSAALREVDTDLGTLITFYRSMIDALVKRKFLTPAEGRVAHTFFEGAHNRFDGHAREKFILYLRLVWVALQDKTVARELGAGKGEFDEKDIYERFAAWLRAGPIDAELAYLLDNLSRDASAGGSAGRVFESRTALLEAIERDPSIIGTGRSCVGGSLNRLIEALNLMHPDVTVLAGTGTLRNNELMKLDSILGQGAAAFLRKVYKEKPDQFDNPEALKAQTQEHLRGVVSAAASEFALLTPPEQQGAIDAFLRNGFERLMGEASALRPVIEYIEGTAEAGGLRADLVGALQSYRGPLEGLADEATAQTRDLLVAELRKVSSTPPTEAVLTPLLAEADSTITIVCKMYKKQLYLEEGQRVAESLKVRQGQTKTQVQDEVVEGVVGVLHAGGRITDSEQKSKKYDTEIQTTLLGDPGIRQRLKEKIEAAAAAA